MSMQSQHKYLRPLDHPCPIKLVVLLLELLDTFLVLPELNAARSHPLARLYLEQVADDLRGEPPSETGVSRSRIQREGGGYSPRELPAAFLSIIDILLPVTRCFARSFNYVPIALLALVVKLDHEVRKVRDHGSAEPSRPRREVDQLLVLGPLSLRH